MSSSYSGLSKAHHILQAMLNVASTESFEMVREQFFRAYMQDNFATGPKVRAQEAEAERKLLGKTDDQPPKEPVSAWRQAAIDFAEKMPGICNAYATRTLADQEQFVANIEQALSKPGTPYERVGNVLAWFKEWRAAKRKEHGHYKKNQYDTAHHKLQGAMTDMVLSVAYAMIRDEKYAPAQALHTLRSQPNGAVVTAPVERVKQPHSFHNYTYFPKQHGAMEEAQRAAWLVRSELYKKQLADASPWVIAMDFSWKSAMCFKDGATVNSKSVPPLYTLGRYLLVADAETWSRENVCNALVMEKTMSLGNNLVSGLETGLSPLPNINTSNYDQWWKEQEHASAKDWRYIRRSSVLLCRQTYDSKMDNITVGDAVARLRVSGVHEVLDGVFSTEDLEIKALLLERIQPDLGAQYTTLKQVEASMGPMPEVIEQALEAALQNKKNAHIEPDFDMGTLFS